MSESYEGRCLCGAIRFAVTPPTLFCVHCHCRFCRGAHGAPIVTWLGVPDGQFSYLEGEDAVVWYASSKQSERGFCPTCGTTLFYVSTLSPGEVHVARACIEGDVDREPVAHVFHDQHVTWLATHDALKKFDTDSELLAKYQKIEV